jgi:hypothetical protein
MRISITQTYTLENLLFFIFYFTRVSTINIQHQVIYTNQPNISKTVSRNLLNMEMYKNVDKTVMNYVGSDLIYTVMIINIESVCLN